MEIHYPPADPRLTYDATLTDATYRVYHRLFARAWHNGPIRQLALTKSELLALLGCSQSSLYVHLNTLVSKALIAYYSADGRTVITIKSIPEFWNHASKPETDSRILESIPGFQNPGQSESPAPLKELINTVVVVNDLNHKDQLLLGSESPDFWTQWPVAEICDAAGVYPSRRPGLAKWPVFVAWLLYGYQHKAETRGEGIVSPALFAISRLDMQPAPVYLELAQAGPLQVLDAMEDWYGTREIWSTVLSAAKANGFYDLLTHYFPDEEVEQD